MRKYPFSQVDAFTQTRLQGNPCAIILDADDLTDQEMLDIAREMNLSETSFVLRSSKADFRFRYFTPSEEIPLAGHPTIATIFRLRELGKILSNKTHIKIELNAGVIDVRIEPDSKIAMSQLPPLFLKTYSQTEILSLFGLPPESLMIRSPIQTVSTGTPMLMIPLNHSSDLDQVQFDANRFAKFRNQSDFFSAHLFAVNGDETFARHFCPPPDVIEDPFTGSATGAMACYLWKYQLIDKAEFVANQGRHLNRPGKAFVKISGTPNQISTVEVAGHAITCLTGELVLP